MPDGNRNTQMDGLRGYAAIAVIVFHSILDRDPTQNVRIIRPPIQEAHGLYDVLTKIAFTVVNGEAAVIIFFVLSGAVLFESLQQRHNAFLPTSIGFCIRRFLRLYPTFFVCLCGCLGAFALCGAFAFEAGHFWPNAALYDFSILGASWTLQVEFLAIPFVLIGYWAYRSYGVAGIAGVYAIFATALCAPWMREHFVYYQRFLSCFALGLLVPTRLGKALARLMPQAAWAPVLLAMLICRQVLGLHWWSMDLEQVLAALLITLLFYNRAGGLGTFFDRRVSQYLGRISYSVYLFNIIFLILVEKWSRGIVSTKTHPLEWGLLLAVPVAAAAIATSHATEKGLERPLKELGDRLTRFSAAPRPISALS